MASLSQQLGTVNDLSETRRKPLDRPLKNTNKKIKQNLSKSIPKDNSKHIKHDPLVSVKKSNETVSSSSTFNPYNAERSIFTEYSAIDGHTNSKLEHTQTTLKQQTLEKDNQNVEQALEKIQFTLQEVSDLEQVINMSKKLSSDSVYVREVMSRLLVRLNKIETLNNKTIIQRKNEGLLFIRNRIKELVKHAEEIKRKMSRGSFNAHADKKDVQDKSQSKRAVGKGCNTEQGERKKLKQESSKCLKLTTIVEDSEREEINDEPTHAELSEATEDMGLKENHLDQNSSKEELCDNVAAIRETNEEENRNLPIIQEDSFFAFPMDPAEDNSSVQKPFTYHTTSNLQNAPNSFASNLNQSNSSILEVQNPLCSPYVLVPEESNSNIQKVQLSPSSFALDSRQNSLCSSSFALDSSQNSLCPSFIFPDLSKSNVQNVQPSLSCPLDLNSSQNNLKFKRLVGPYIIINQDICNSTVTSTTTTIQEHLEENSNIAECLSSEDAVTITEETTSIRRSFQKVNVESASSSDRRSIELIPGAPIQLRLLLILLLSLILEIPIFMIMCPNWM